MPPSSSSATASRSSTPSSRRSPRSTRASSPSSTQAPGRPTPSSTSASSSNAARARPDPENQNMDDEERQRTMDFILRQQAQFTVGMQKLEEQQAQFSGELKSVRRVVVLLARQFRRERGDLRERIAALVDAQIRSEERLSGSDRSETPLKAIPDAKGKAIARLNRQVGLTAMTSALCF